MGTTESIRFDPLKLEQVRQARLFSKRMLSKLSGVNRVTVSNAFKGEPVALESARLICERLGVTRDEVCKP